MRGIQKHLSSPTQDLFKSNIAQNTNRYHFHSKLQKGYWIGRGQELHIGIDCRWDGGTCTFVSCQNLGKLTKL